MGNDGDRQALCFSSFSSLLYIIGGDVPWSYLRKTVALARLVLSDSRCLQSCDYETRVRGRCWALCVVVVLLFAVFLVRGFDCDGRDCQCLIGVGLWRGRDDGNFAISCRSSRLVEHLVIPGVLFGWSLKALLDD